MNLTFLIIRYLIVLNNLRISAEIYENLAKQRGILVEKPVSTHWEEKVDTQTALLHGFSKFHYKEFDTIAMHTILVKNGIPSLQTITLSQQDIKNSLILLTTAIEDTVCLICIMREWLIPLMDRFST